jgi:hypothetical protein
MLRHLLANPLLAKVHAALKELFTHALPAVLALEVPMNRLDMCPQCVVAHAASVAACFPQRHWCSVKAVAARGSRASARVARDGSRDARLHRRYRAESCRRSFPGERGASSCLFWATRQTHADAARHFSGLPATRVPRVDARASDRAGLG